MTDKTKRAGEKDGKAEKAFEQYGKSVSLDIKREDKPFWSSDKHWFAEGYAAGRASRDGLKEALEEMLRFDPDGDLPLVAFYNVARAALAQDADQ